MPLHLFPQMGGRRRPGKREREWNASWRSKRGSGMETGTDLMAGSSRRPGMWYGDDRDPGQGADLVMWFGDDHHPGQEAELGAQPQNRHPATRSR